MPETTTDKKGIERNVMREVRHCAIGVHHSDNKERVISHFYEVKSVRLAKRCELSTEQAGRVDSSNDAAYWLFELGYARPLLPPIKMPIRAFKFQLTSASDLLAAKDWESLTKRYAMLT